MNPYLNVDSLFSITLMTSDAVRKTNVNSKRYRILELKFVVYPWDGGVTERKITIMYIKNVHKDPFRFTAQLLPGKKRNNSSNKIIPQPPPLV